MNNYTVRRNNNRKKTISFRNPETREPLITMLTPEINVPTSSLTTQVEFTRSSQISLRQTDYPVSNCTEKTVQELDKPHTQ